MEKHELDQTDARNRRLCTNVWLPRRKATAVFVEKSDKRYEKQRTVLDSSTESTSRTALNRCAQYMFTKYVKRFPPKVNTSRLKRILMEMSRYKV